MTDAPVPHRRRALLAAVLTSLAIPALAGTGEEPPQRCNGNFVSIGMGAFVDGDPVSAVEAGDLVTYDVFISVPADSPPVIWCCQSGELSITLPNGENVQATVPKVCAGESFSVFADYLVDGLSLFENQQGRDPANPVVRGGLRVAVDVELGKFYLAVHLLRELLDYGGDHLAGSAPLGPKVHQHGCIRVDDLGLEGVVGDSDGLSHSVLSS